LPLEIKLLRGESWDPFYRFNTTKFLASPTSGFPKKYVMVYFMINEVRWYFFWSILVELLINHHCINFLSITLNI